MILINLNKFKKLSEYLLIIRSSFPLFLIIGSIKKYIKYIIIIKYGMCNNIDENLNYIKYYL